MKRLFLPQIILSVLFLWALYPHNPYTYYVLLKWISFPVFIYLFIVYKNNMQIGIFFIILAILYNPIKILHLDRIIWSYLNMATVIFLIISIFLKRKEDNEQNH